MLTRLALKEFRETFWIALLGLLAYSWALREATGGWLFGSPLRIDYGFVIHHSQFTGPFLVISGCLVIVLGLRQSAVESARGTDLFLLHRPVDRRVVVGVKLLVGLGLYLIFSAMMVLRFGWWAATPGMHASPFEWSMLQIDWCVWITMTGLYLGSFLTGFRPGRWFGTRLLPLVGVGLLLLLGGQFLWERWPFLYWVPAVLVVDLLLVAVIFYVAGTRDYS
jgi:hypothetical protein